MNTKIYIGIALAALLTLGSPGASAIAGAPCDPNYTDCKAFIDETAAGGKAAADDAYDRAWNEINNIGPTLEGLGQTALDLAGAGVGIALGAVDTGVGLAFDTAFFALDTAEGGLCTVGGDGVCDGLGPIWP